MSADAGPPTCDLAFSRGDEGVDVRNRLALGALSCALVLPALAATVLKPSAPVNVSRSAESTEKVKAVRLAYLDGAAIRKAWVLTYGDGPPGRQNIYVRYSLDDGATWAVPRLLSHDAAGAPTGGALVRARDALGFVADNDKPSIFAPPTTAGPAVVIVWNSAYCPQDPAAATAGSYVNPVQGAGDFDGDGVPDRPFHCVWTATSVDPGLAAWDVRQLTNGTRDAIGEVVAGNATGTAYALAWQEDPAGLQPGEAEGRGDGGMGSHVTGGTNIWYTHAAMPSGASLRANIVQLSDNNVLGSGQPGASRPNLQISGSTAAVAYEESSCPGGNGGKCIIYHSFPVASHDTDAAGTIVSDVTRHARRVRFVLQGAAAAGTSSLRMIMLWRESPSAVSAAPADIVLRRGRVDTLARPGSTGFLASDLLAEATQAMTAVASVGGNANAHRAILRGDFVALAYDLTPDMDGANAEKTDVPTANYNLFVTRSTDGAAPGRWSAPLNLSGLASPAITVVEPRLVPTPGTVVNPLTGVPDAGDTQDGNVLYVAYATESNTLVGQPGRVYVSRSTDQGATFEPFVPVSARTSGQSEAQLRPTPDGSSAAIVWMEEQAPGDVDSKEAMYALLTAAERPDLRIGMPDVSLAVGGVHTLHVALSNPSAGTAHRVVVTLSLPAGLRLVGIGDPGTCGIQEGGMRCALSELGAAQSRVFSVTVAGVVEGSYEIALSATSEDLDVDVADNEAVAKVTATAAPLEPPEPGTSDDAGGGGCTLARAGTRLDATLPLLALVALLGLMLGRVRRPTRRLGHKAIDR